jgi:hypothetical protein
MLEAIGRCIGYMVYRIGVYSISVYSISVYGIGV